MAKVWKNQASASPATEPYEKHLAALLQETGCAAEGAPFVLRGFLRQLGYGDFHFEPQSPQPRKLAKAFLDEAHCPGALGLTEEVKAQLREIQQEAEQNFPPPPAAKKKK